MKSSSEPKVAAVIVTFHADLGVLERQISLLKPQVSDILIVDNGSSVDFVNWSKSSHHQISEIIFLNENRGIATAHNIGIEWARKHFSNFVLLMDHDSIPATDMVEKLISAASALENTGSVGPRYRDERQNNPPPFIRIEGLKLVRCKCNPEVANVPVDYLISSGCLIPMAVLDKVGLMREDFFIDYVDIEWGMRARAKGFQSYGVCSAHMQHSLGDEPIKFFGKNIPLHSPLRHYYHFRNAVFLYKESWVPLNWKLVDGWRLCLKYVFYSLFAKPRTSHWKMMSLGIWHGIIGKAGKLQK